VVIYFLSLGSNEGDRQAYLKDAISRLGGDTGGGAEVLAVASLYETSPVGYTSQANFLNTAVAVRSSTDPPGMLALCKKIEQDMGRDTPFRWGPREIDLDLVWWGEGSRDEESRWIEKKWESPELVIPHPRTTERLFVLIPLAEIAPGLPIHGKPVESWIVRLEQPREQVNHLPPVSSQSAEQLVRKIAAAPQWHAGVPV
jgi:2-amino-4-hydroxy-6-hydroxymethyldihydropteridine diphosphokinase